MKGPTLYSQIPRQCVDCDINHTIQWHRNKWDPIEIGWLCHVCYLKRANADRRLDKCINKIVLSEVINGY